jgi:hypothetical protein
MERIHSGCCRRRLRVGSIGTTPIDQLGRERDYSRFETTFGWSLTESQEGSNIVWAFVVYNYDEKMIQILEVTQNQFMTGIKALVDSRHWGDPKGYNISISRSGSGFETEYVTQGVRQRRLQRASVTNLRK